mmetsp:Transcript_46790/g.134782  ORF Transcript_46790/g.134782 Transcript_46790/m.134782 type:complete len:225 (+) Transcript_46790:622-1296(+)
MIVIHYRCSQGSGKKQRHQEVKGSEPQGRGHRRDFVELLVVESLEQDQQHATDAPVWGTPALQLLAEQDVAAKRKDREDEQQHDDEVHDKARRIQGGLHQDGHTRLPIEPAKESADGDHAKDRTRDTQPVQQHNVPIEPIDEAHKPVLVRIGRHCRFHLPLCRCFCDGERWHVPEREDLSAELAQPEDVVVEHPHDTACNHDHSDVDPLVWIHDDSPEVFATLQ